MSEKYCPKHKYIEPKCLACVTRWAGELNRKIDACANAERVIAWMKDPKRKPANLAFTEGPERQIAYQFEARHMLLEAVAEAARTLIDESYLSANPYIQAHKIHWDKLEKALTPLQSDREPGERGGV